MIAIRKLLNSPLWALQSPWSPALRDACKEMPGMIWDPNIKSWVGYIDAVEAVANNLAVKDPASRWFPTKVNRGALEARSPGSNSHHVLYAINGISPSGERLTLRSYQKEAVDFLICNAPSGAILADEMGLGKSAVAIVMARAFSGRTLIICPSSARSVWADPKRGEIAKWWPKAMPKVFLPEGLQSFREEKGPTLKAKCVECGAAAACGQCLAGEACILDPKCGNSPNSIYTVPCEKTGEMHRWSREKIIKIPISPIIPDYAELIVIHYDILHAWADALAAWGPSNIIWDEAHYLQTEKSRRSKTSKELSRCPTVKSRTALTGTPLVNRIETLWNIIDTVSAQRMGKNFFKFGLRYCDGHQEDISRDIGSRWNFSGKSNLEELSRRLKWISMRRTTEEVGLELPEKTRQVIRMEIPVNFRQGTGEQVNIKALGSLMRKAVDAKMPLVVDLAKGHLEAGASTIVFCYRRAVAEHFVTQLSATGATCRFIHGGVPQHQRDAILEELRSAQGPVFLAATIDCCAVAIDLTFARVAIFAELTYEPHELLQAEKRPHRFGQKGNVLIQYPIAEGTVEEAIAEVVIDRLGDFEQLFGKTDGLADALKGEQENIMRDLGARLLAMGA